MPRYHVTYEAVVMRDISGSVVVDATNEEQAEIKAEELIAFKHNGDIEYFHPQDIEELE